ncbi:spermidine synthase [Nakamurella lactea]|uniref:spermidine synthase n=1 Tax=Nakamurella lactea TaxID=459515 RepID=UPI0003FE93F4|nr:fused MFS/spermidine synthase [Nakamurella lactea]
MAAKRSRSLTDDLLPAGSEVLLDIATDHGALRIEQDPSRPSGRLVFLDGVACSYIDLDDPGHLEFTYIRRFADIIAALWPSPEPLRVSHVGGGGVSFPRYLADTRPRSSQIVYEYDGALIELSRQHLGLVTHPGLKIKIGDARPRMDRRTPDSADVVVGDAFVGRVVPPALSSVEYVRQVRSVLGDSGIYLLNVIAGPDLHLARRHAATLRSEFPTVLVSSDPDVLSGKVSGNLVFLATGRRAKDLPLGAILRACTSGSYPDRVIRPEEIAAFIAHAPVLTD